MNALTLGVVITNPALWAGAVALGAPLLVHLLTRKAMRELLFPTIRFLKSARASQSRVYKLRHLLLWALRTAVVALLLFAFLKPVIQERTLAAPPGQPQKNAVMIILDSSLSMSYTGAGYSPFARAQQAAGKMLDDLRAGDMANVIFAAATPQVVFAEPTPSQFPLRHDLQNAAPTLERADMDAAIAEAVRQLGKLAGFSKEIHFISDFQRDNWAAVKFAAIPKDVKTVFVSVAEPDAGNCAITEVVLQPPAPAVREDVQVVAKVANYSAQARQLPLQLKFGDETVLRHELTIPAHSSASGSFRIRANRSGVFEGELSIPDDNLAADNRRYFALDVTDRVRVVVLSDEARHDPAAGHRFVVKGLNPFAEAGRGSIETTVLTTDQFDKFAAARATVVIVAGVNPFGDATAGTLLQYLRDGGGVLWFLSGLSDKANLTKLQTLAGGDLQLPFQMNALINRAAKDTDEPAAFTQANFDAPLLKPFKDGRDLGSVRVWRYFATERTPAQGEVLLRYDDRNVALARKSIGLGSLLIANFSPALTGNDLAKRTIFVPLLHEMVKAMRPQVGGRKSFAVGGPASTTVALPAESQGVRFTNPAGDKINAVFEVSKTDAAVIFPTTKDIGFYRVNIGARQVGAVAVNVDARESNLAALTVKQLQEQSEIGRDRFFTSAGGNLVALERLREGRPLWHYCLAGVLGVLAIEQLLAAAGKQTK